MADAPRLFRVRQHFQTEQVDDIEAEVESQLRQLNLAEKIQPGQSVAVTAGSRGIANIAKIVRGCVQHLRQLVGRQKVYFCETLCDRGSQRSTKTTRCPSGR